MTTTTTTARQRAEDQLLELAVLAQLHMWAIEEQANDEPEDNLPLWRMQRDANVMAMLMLSGIPTADQVNAGIARVREVARLALDEVSTPGRFMAAGYVLPEHRQEPPVLEYMAAIRAQERAIDPWAQVAVEQAKQAPPLTMPLSKAAYVRLQWREAGQCCPACTDETTAKAHWPVWGCEKSRPGEPLVFHCDCGTCQP